MAEKIRVGVIFGGRSGEHEVSLMSARSILNALDPDKYQIVPIGISREGRWLLLSDPVKALEQPIRADAGTPLPITVDPTAGNKLIPRGERVAEEVQQGIDVVFPVLHGTYGEDGTVQGLLELANVPYVGAGVAASAVAMDKALAKAVFAAHGFPQAEYLVILRSEWEKDQGRVIQTVESRFTYPCFVKPANAGSSVGVSKAKSRDRLVDALHTAAKYDRKIIVEQAVLGREIEVAVLGNDDPVASVPGEVIPGKEFYDYEAKYFDSGLVIKIPANLPPAVSDEVRDLAIKAYRAIDCAGMARVDFFVTPEYKVLINEVNTIPGFTANSMYPMLWAASGMPIEKLVARLLELAVERHQDKNRSQTTLHPDR